MVDNIDFKFDCTINNTENVDFHFPFKQCSEVEEKEKPKCEPSIALGPHDFRFDCPAELSNVVDFHFPFKQCSGECEIDDTKNTAELVFDVHECENIQFGFVEILTTTPIEIYDGDSLPVELIVNKPFNLTFATVHINFQRYIHHPYDGDNLSVTLFTTSILTLNNRSYRDGDNVEVVFTTYRVFKINSTLHDGEILNTHLLHSALLDSQSYDGENTSTHIIYSVLLDSNSHDGEIVNAHLIRSVLLDSNSHDSDNITAQIQTSRLLTLTSHDAENLNTQLQIIASLFSNIRDGENITAQVQTSTLLFTNSYDGDITRVNTFDFHKGLQPVIIDGEYVDLTDIDTTKPDVDLGDVQAYDGELVSPTLSRDISVLFEALAYDGDLANFNVNYASIVLDKFINVYDGSASTSELFTIKGQPLSSQLYDGELGSAEISREIQFSSPFTDGELITLSVVSDYSSIIYLVDGDVLSPFFKIDPVYAPELYDDDRLEFDLHIRPSVNFSFDVDVLDGDNIWFTTERLKGITLKPVTIMDSDWFNAEWSGDSSLIFSLCNSCDVIVGCQFEIDYGNPYYNLWEYSADLVERFDIAFSVSRTFEFNCSDGEYATSRLFDRYLILESVSMYDSVETSKVFPFYHTKTFVFDNSADLPDADFADVDLSESDKERPLLEYVECGETVKSFLSIEPIVGVKCFDGEIFTFDIALWTWPRITDSEQVEFHLSTTVKLEPGNIDDGELTDLYEPPEYTLAHDGEHMEVKMRTDYDVKFEEIGCVSNEYIPRKDGKLDHRRYTTAAVEFEMFEYSIKGTCY